MYISINRSQDLSLGLSFKHSLGLKSLKSKNNTTAFDEEILTNIGLREMSLFKVILSTAHLLSVMATARGGFSSSGAIRKMPDLTEMAAEPIRDILTEIAENDFSVIFISDGYSTHSSTFEVLDKVEVRESYIASVFHAVLPMRLKRFDYSSVYEYSSVDFSFAKPEVKPQWQSLYYPLSHGVWISTGVLFVIMAGLVIIFVRVSDSFMDKNRLDAGTALLETLGTLLGQNLSHGFPKSQSWRVLLGSWMVFAFIFGSAFRGNLIAYLTLPKYPPRPENLKELLRVAERITMPPYGKDFKAFFSQSDSEDFLKLAKLMQIVPSVHEGQEQALQRRQAHLDTRRYQEHYIAQFHTRIDGSTKLYVGREGVLPGKSAWPLPHDAPYATAINRGLIAVLEASLYEHWSKQLIEETKSETRRRLREQQAMMMHEGNADHSTDSSGQATMALTLVHVQGPLMLLLIGHILALSAFASEYAMSFYVKF
ncbi:ionotropic receptor 93a-like isoform X3 [Macrobrachium rosenbergii]|uniref:ionotropic receptor 93a-like isoform X3 n=1 Tax=Macrobrachium rosenbergii TaxID=79674 RepID=UPI0034D412D8